MPAPSPIPRRALPALVLACAAAGGAPFGCADAAPAGTTDRLDANGDEWWSGADDVALEPTAAIQENGELVVVWIAWNDGAPALVAETGTGSRAVIAEGADWYANPRLARDSGGLLCAWEEGAEGERSVKTRSLSAGALRELDPAPGGDVLAAGNVLSPWPVEIDNEDGGTIAIVATRATDGGPFELVQTTSRSGDESYGIDPGAPTRAFDPMEPVRTADGQPLARGDVWVPRVASSGDGRYHVVFDAFEDGRFQVHHAIVEDGVAVEHRRFPTGAGYQGFPSIALEPGGAAWIAWEEADQLGEIGGLRAARRLALARVEDGRVQVAKPSSLPPSELRCDFPEVAWSEGGLTVTMRGLGPDFAVATDVVESTEPHDPEPRDRVYIDAKARFYTTWWTRVLSFAADGSPSIVELPVTEGDNEATETLVVRNGRVEAVFTADRRSAARPRPSAFSTPIESTWRVGRMLLPETGGVPALQGLVPRDPPAPATDPVPVKRARDGERRVVYGDLHRHTHVSRCSGSQDGTLLDTYRYARGPGHLDFVAITDHFQHLNPWSWWRNLRDVERFHAPGRLVAFAAVERAGKARGHRNDVYRDGQGVPFERDAWNAFPEGEREEPPLGTERISIPHMTGRSESPFEWRWFDPEAHALFEVYQGARGSYEGPNLPYVADDYDVPRARVGRGLELGLDFGFIGAADHAASSNGIAGVFAEELTREAVFDALQARATFAATDFVRADASLGELRAGESGAAPADAPFVVRARGTSPVAAVEVVKNGEPLRYAAGDDPDRALLVLTTRRWGPWANRPMVVGAEGATLATFRPRARGATQASLQPRDDGSFALSKEREPLDVVLTLVDPTPEAALTFALGEESVRVPLADLERGRATRLPAPVDRELLLLVGSSLGADPLELATPDPDRTPGDAYYARVVFEDGNVAWTSPIRVTATGGER